MIENPVSFDVIPGRTRFDQIAKPVILRQDSKSLTVNLSLQSTFTGGAAEISFALQNIKFPFKRGVIRKIISSLHYVPAAVGFAYLIPHIFQLNGGPLYASVYQQGAGLDYQLTMAGTLVTGTQFNSYLVFANGVAEYKDLTLIVGPDGITNVNVKQFVQFNTAGGTLVQNGGAAYSVNDVARYSLDLFFDVIEP